MDAGTAAVLGALAGSTATIGAALATGWAQREGARITARSEHRMERRQPRHDIYKEFITEANRMRALTSVWGIDLHLTPEPTDQRVRHWGEVARSLESKASDTALAGPAPVSKAAIKISRMAAELNISLGTYRSVVDDGETVLQQEMRRQLLAQATNYSAALTEFILTAQSALDDDGSRK
ncbi:hypothetical protein [Streptomyces sp. NPDC047070]|uniref:hypothetical protein n=1 Tax=Streptomyces sp. NPDC047070 TaxID=3154923 RepID=UPI00345159CF